MNDDYFLVAGDFNVDFLRPSSTCDLLKSFITDNNLKLVSNFIPNLVDFTFESKGIVSKSLIDHFIVSENLLCNIHDYSVIMSCDNFSDHFPVRMCLKI